MSDPDRTQRDDPRTRPGMASSLVLSTAVFARVHGVSDTEITRATGLSLAEISAPDARLPNDAVAKIWQLLIARHPGRPLPLEMAKATPLSFFGPLAWGVQYAPTARQALDTFRRYQGLLSDALDTAIVEDGDEVRLTAQHPTDALDGGAGAHVGLALGHRFAREVLQAPGELLRVELAEPTVGDPSHYIEFFGAPVVRSDVRALVFRAAEVEAALPARDETLFATIQAHLAIARKRVAMPDALQPIRNAIASNAERGDYSAGALAKSLGMSLRVLQRQVSARGTTLSALLDGARRANAEQLLSDPTLSVEQVGFLLGYSEERAFRRAFKRICGVSPAEFRRQNRA